MAMFGMITQLYTHTGLAPQQPGLQGVGAPQLAVTPAPAPAAAPATTTTPETTFSMSALLGSTGRPLFSPLPATTLFQDSPSVVQSVALPVVPQAPLPGEEEERSLYFHSRRSRQLQQSRLQMATLLLLTRLPLLRTLSQAVPAREPPRQLHLQSAQTRSSRPSPRVLHPTTTTTTTCTASSPCHDSRTRSSPFWCFDAKGGES